MTDSYQYSLYENRRAGISVACLALCLIFLLVERVFPFLPDNIYSYYRPVFIIICFLPPAVSMYPLRFLKLYVVIVVYFTIVFLLHPITADNTTAYLSVATFGLFLIVCGSIEWTPKEIRWLMFAVVIGSFVQSLIILSSNSGLLHGSGAQQVDFLGRSVNRNPPAFAITMGVICGIFSLLYGKEILKKRIWITLAVMVVICGYTVVALGCRSAFVSMFLGTAGLLWFSAGKTDERNSTRTRVIMIVLFLLIFIIGLHFTEGTYSERLFHISTSDDSGRHEIWEKCWAHIKQKPVFGGGFDNFPADWEMGTHNTFLTWMLYGGILIVLIWAVFFFCVIKESYDLKNYIPVAFLAETFMHCYTETDMDYYAYIPMILAVILINYLRYVSSDFQIIFLE